ncbi:hypothetical protein ABPG72_008813 [Tetrahymena utriculariae]
MGCLSLQKIVKNKLISSPRVAMEMILFLTIFNSERHPISVYILWFVQNKQDYIKKLNIAIAPIFRKIPQAIPQFLNYSLPQLLLYSMLTENTIQRMPKTIFSIPKQEVGKSSFRSSLSADQISGDIKLLFASRSIQLTQKFNISV